MSDNKKVHAFSNDALGNDDAVGLAQKLQNKEVSSEELIKASIERAKIVEPKLKAIVTDTFDKALIQSKQQQEGFFAGLPIFIKDLTNVEGEKTFYGTESLKNAPVSTFNDPIAKQIFAQGFIHLGNTSLPEFGFTCSTEFPNQEPTANPWHIDYSCGGSSGGSAALVAAGVVPIAHTADGGGSTRIPAACCGLVGLKASRGRVLASQLFQQQIIDIAIDGMTSRSVRDTAYFYAEAEKYYKNPKLKPIGLVTGASNKKYKIGFTNNSLKGINGDAPTEAVLLDTVKKLEDLGHEVKMIDLPISEQFVDDFVYLWEMLAFYSKHFGKFIFGKHFEKDKLTNFMHGLAKSHPKNMLKMPFFLSRLKKTYQDYSNLFTSLDVDFLLTPTLSATTPKNGYLNPNLEFEEMFERMKNWASYTPYGNASGGPSISLPMGEDPLNKMPIGMLFWGNHGEEAMLLDLAYQLEEAYPWKKITDLI